MSTWTNSKDGVPRIEVRVPFRLDARELAEVLAERVDEHEAAALSARRVREHVTEELYSYGMCSAMDDDRGFAVTGAHRAAIARAYGAALEPTQ